MLMVSKPAGRYVTAAILGGVVLVLFAATIFSRL